MPTSNAVVKKALSRDMVPPEKPKAVRAAKAARGNWPANPYAEDCPTRLVLDRIADKWTVLLLILLTKRPWRFNELRREIGVDLHGLAAFDPLAVHDQGGGRVVLGHGDLGHQWPSVFM